MFREIKSALLACVATFVLCAIIYPGVVWGLALLSFPRHSEGSLVYRRDRTVVGSERIGQPFVSKKYVWPRPSAVDYKADAAGGSNLGSNNPDLRAKVEARALALGATKERPAPVELVTASGSGLDPDISPEGARYQAQRVATARGVSVDAVNAVIDHHVDTSGAILGAPARVNVLELNRALDAAFSEGTG